ncbi:MAG: hypothetical protein RSF40_01980 [Oscillospiraceae bacterium]
MLEPIITQKIIITTDGKETLVRLYENNEVVKTAKASCCPDDEFDFETGSKLALERLFKPIETKPTTYNARVVPIGEILGVSQVRGITIGKIYTVVDNVFTNDRGWKTNVKNSFDELKRLGYKFIEIKEDC